MRILAITNLYPRPGYETVASFNRQQLRALAADHEMAIVAPVLWTEEWPDRWAGRRTPSSYRNADGVRVCHPVYYYPPKMLQHFYGECYLASIRPAVSRLLERFHPDVVLSCFAHPDGWAAVRIARDAGLPIIVKVVGSDVLVNAARGRRRRRIAEGLRSADGVVAVSHDLASQVVRLGVDPSKVHVVGNGIDRSLFHPGDRRAARARLGLPTEDRIILFVGNLLMSKGAGTLADACALLAGRGVQFTCQMVGRGPHEARLRALIARSGLSDRVYLAGARPHPELADWYRSCDVVALPSFSEGIPNVLLEASACGRPFVATRVGGIPEIADPATSVLVSPGSAVELAEALERVLDRGPMDAGYAPASSWGESASRLAAHLSDAIRAKGPFRRTDSDLMEPHTVRATA